MSILTPKLFNQFTPKGHPVLDTRPTKPTQYLEDGTRNLYFYTRNYNQGGVLVPSSTNGTNFIPQRPLNASYTPYNEKTIANRRLAVFDYQNFPHEVKPIVPTGWVPNTVLESSLIVHPDGLPRNPTPQGAILDQTEINNRIMQAEAQGDNARAQMIRDRYDSTGRVQEQLKKRIQDLRDAGDDKQADELSEKYFPDSHRHRQQIGGIDDLKNSIDNLGRNLRRGGISSASISGMDKQIEEKFNEILKNRPADIADEIRRNKEMVETQIAELEAKGDPVPPELLSFKQKFKMFNEGVFTSKFGRAGVVDPKKLSETNKTALENLARFLEGRSPTSSPPTTPTTSRRSSTTGLPTGVPIPPPVPNPALIIPKDPKDGQLLIDDFKKIRNDLLSKYSGDMTKVDPTEFKDIRNIAKRVLSNTEFKKLEKDYDDKKINNADYTVKMTLRINQLQDYIDAKVSGPTKPTGPTGPGIGKLEILGIDMVDSKEVNKFIDDEVGKGTKKEDVIKTLLEELQKDYNRNKTKYSGTSSSVRRWKGAVVNVVAQKMGILLDPSQIRDFVDKRLDGRIKKLSSIVSFVEKTLK